jgi:hypothetical protein
MDHKLQQIQHHLSVVVLEELAQEQMRVEQVELIKVVAEVVEQIVILVEQVVQVL